MFHDLFCDLVCTNVVNVIRAETNPTLRVVILIVSRSRETGAKTGVHRLVFSDQRLVVSQPEHSAVREEGLLSGVFLVDPSTWVLRRVPCVEVSIEVHDRHWAIDLVESAKGWESNAVIAT
jgi:hypothetical protein